MAKKQKASAKKKQLLPKLIQHAVALHQAGELVQAEQQYQHILKQYPNDSGILHLLGVLAAQKQDYAKAVDLIQQAIAINPQDANFYLNLGHTYKANRQFEQAIAAYQQVIRLQPHNINTHYELAKLYQQQMQTQHAIVCYKRVLALQPQFFEACSQLAVMLQQQGIYQEALHYFQQAAKLQPQNINALSNLAAALAQQGQYESAIDYYQKALALDSNNAMLHYNLGIAFSRKKQLSLALEEFQIAFDLKPHHVDCCYNLAKTCLQLGQVEVAIEYYHKTLSLQPHHYDAHNSFLLAMHYLRDDNAMDIVAQAKLFNQEFCSPFKPPEYKHLPDPNKRLKIGYVSADFRRHSVTSFIESVLAHHDHSQFEVYCYYNNHHEDEDTQRLKHYADHWLNCANLSDDALATQIQTDTIDILIDLSGHTAGNRLQVFARKPAPIQMSYLGYPDTTGVTAIDYRIVDNYVENALLNSTETRLTMPNSYFCYTPPALTPLVNELPALKNHYLTFGSFNNFSKLTPELLELWAELLKQGPSAKLLLKNASLHDEQLQTQLKVRFQALGIESERLILAGHMETTDEHLNMYHHVDIGLDTFPYNGATTTCEALWMGVPVVTWAGQSHVSRVGLSLLTTMGLTQFVTDSPDAYLARCLKLSQDLQVLANLRSMLRHKMQASPLMKGALFTQHLEQHYKISWQKWCNLEGLNNI